MDNNMKTKIQFLLIFFIPVLLEGCMNDDDSVKASGNKNQEQYKNESFLGYKKDQLDFDIEVVDKNKRYAVFNNTHEIIKDEQNIVLKIYGDSLNPIEYMKKHDADFDATYKEILFGMKSNFVILYGKDTLHCLGYEFENSGNISPYSTFNLVFESKNEKEWKHDPVFIFHDTYFNKRDLILTIDKNDFNNNPYSFKAD